MSIAFEYLISTIILIPLIPFLITFVICRKRRKTNAKSFGIAADITTFILFFSVSLSISGLWGMSYSVIIFVLALFIAMLYTYKDWRNKKEIEIFPLFKKIWRSYFIILTVAYIVIWVVGLSQNIIEFVEVI